MREFDENTEILFREAVERDLIVVRALLRKIGPTPHSHLDNAPSSTGTKLRILAVETKIISSLSSITISLDILGCPLFLPTPAERLSQFVTQWGPSESGDYF